MIFVKFINKSARILARGKEMAEILENSKGRRNIRLNKEDILNVVREYQNTTVGSYTYNEIREKLDTLEIILPEDIN